MTNPTPSQPSPDVAGIVERLREPDWHDPACPFSEHCYCSNDGEPAPHDRISDALKLEAAAALTTLSAENKALREERETLRLEMLGGEDAPGYAASLPLVQVIQSFREHQATSLQAAESSAAKWKAEAERMAEALQWGVRLGDVVLKNWAPQPGPHAIKLSDGTIVHGESADAIAAVCEAVAEFAEHAQAALRPQEGKADA